MDDLQQGSVSSIAAGKIGHAKCLIQWKKEDGLLGRLDKIISVIGGNDLELKHDDGTKSITMTLQQLQQMMQEFAQWVRETVPWAKVVTLDLIPRDTPRAKFLMMAKNCSGTS